MLYTHTLSLVPNHISTKFQGFFYYCTKRMYASLWIPCSYAYNYTNIFIITLEMSNTSPVCYQKHISPIISHYNCTMFINDIGGNKVLKKNTFFLKLAILDIQNHYVTQKAINYSYSFDNTFVVSDI